ALARRLLRRWRPPAWLSRIVEHLGLEIETACSMGADPMLLRIVQTSIALVQQQGRGLHLTFGTALNENLIALNIPLKELESMSSDLDAYIASETVPNEWLSPYGVPLLNDLIKQAAENQQLRASAALEQLEREHDRLHRALESRRRGE